MRRVGPNGRHGTAPTAVARGDGLSDEDTRLWEMMKQRLEPLARRKTRVLSGMHAALAPPPGSSMPDTGAIGPRPPSRRLQPTPGPAAVEPPTLMRAWGHARPEAARPAKPATVQPALTIEKRKTRLLATGRRRIDAVLDLHGMRQAEAHAALRQFVRAQQAGGCKFVKVITGKGARLGDDDGREPGHHDHGAVPAGERGVLRRLVPLWLQQADLRALVVAASPAGRGHGGDGALYVELRRHDRTR